MLKSGSEIQAPAGFTAKVMESLPKEKKRVGYMRWFRAHPIITAAAIFFLFMFSGIFSAWNQDGQLSVSKQQNLIIKDDTVIVPEDVVVDGDLVVKNGDLKIEGEVNGDVVIINGDHLMASAGQVSGDLKEVNQVFDWIWYHIKDIAKSVFSWKD
ncbi:anti-sigma factor [Virgibacillus senegalensis]|uniref:anti-sigma factor n=1 Tax=Virgibacillus senegalensis TaxID=1499679 RepID=UPI000A4B7DE0|nr:anti-sigma factor [Virgibacillus senegalensis]